MTLTRSSVESPFFTDPSGSHSSSSNRTVTAGRLQFLSLWSYSDAGYPDYGIATDDFTGFDWVELVDARRQLETYLSVLGYSRFVQMTLWYGYATVTESHKTTAEFGTVTTSHGVNGRAGGWTHTQIAGFTEAPTDDGRSLIRQLVTDGAETPTQIFGGQDAARMDLPLAPLTAQSLTALHPLVEHASSANSSMYTTDGTKDVVVAAASYPSPSEIVLRNSQDIYAHDGDDGADEGRWAGVALEIAERPDVPSLPGTPGSVSAEGLILPVRLRDADRIREYAVMRSDHDLNLRHRPHYVGRRRVK